MLMRSKYYYLDNILYCIEKKLFTCSEVATRGVLCKKLFLEISHKNSCGRVSFLIKLQASGLPIY